MKKTDCIWMKDDLCWFFVREGEDRDCDGCLKHDVERSNKNPYEFTITIEGRAHLDFESDMEEQLRASLIPLYKELNIKKVEISFGDSRSASVFEFSNKED